RQGRGGRRRAGEKTAPPSDARRDQGGFVIQDIPARPHLPPLGDAGNRRGMEADRGDGVCRGRRGWKGGRGGKGKTLIPSCPSGPSCPSRPTSTGIPLAPRGRPA